MMPHGCKTAVVAPSITSITSTTFSHTTPKGRELPTLSHVVTLAVKGKEGRVLGKSVSETQARERGTGKSWGKTTRSAHHSEMQQSSLGIIPVQDAR